jgi:hypothetical protein
MRSLWRLQADVRLTAVRARNFSVRIVIEGRRPHPTIDASGDARADRAWLAGRPAHGPRLTGRPRSAEAKAHLPFMLLDMPAAAGLGVGWSDRRNQHQRRRGYRQRQKPDRQFAHASLPRWGQAMRKPTDGTPRRKKYSRGEFSASGFTCPLHQGFAEDLHTSEEATSHTRSLGSRPRLARGKACSQATPDRQTGER